MRHYQPAASWRSAGCGAPTAEPPRGQLPRLSLCHLAEVPSNTVLRSVNRWRVVKAPGDHSRSKRPPFSRRRGRRKTSPTCDHLQRAAPGGRRLAKVARRRKSRGFESGPLTLGLIESEVRRVNIMLASHGVDKVTLRKAAPENILIEKCNTSRE